MADFGGLASVLQMQNQGLLSQPKQTKQQARKRSLDNADDPNARVNSKLLQLLKENQEDFRLINGSNEQQAQLQQAQDGAYMMDNLDQQGYEIENYVMNMNINFTKTTIVSTIVIVYLMF